MGKPAAILVDTGYENMEQIGQREQTGTTVYCSMGQEWEHHQPRYDFKRLFNLTTIETAKTAFSPAEAGAGFRIAQTFR